jgi:hypothetical protein
MSNELGSGLFGIDFGDITEGSADSVLPDVSFGGPAEQPSTAAGNGFGVYVTGWLDKAVDYALRKDAAQHSVENLYRNQLAAQGAAYQRQQQQRMAGGFTDRQLLMIGGAVLAFVLFTGRKS